MEDQFSVFFDVAQLLAIAGFTYAVVGTGYLWYGLACVPRLGDVVVPADCSNSQPSRLAVPRVSVIAPACNEAAAIEAAVRGFLALDWPRLEVIVINDRSTDGTAAVLQRLEAEGDARLRVLTIADLPTGWLVPG